MRYIGDYIPVKKLIALAMTGCFIYITIIGRVPAEVFMTAFSMVVSFYFGQSTVREATRNQTQNRINIAESEAITEEVIARTE